MKTPLSPRLSAGCEEDFQRRIWKNDCTHIPTVCHKTGHTGPIPLLGQQHLSNFRMQRDLRRAQAPCLRANVCCHILFCHPDGDALLGRPEIHVQDARDCSDFARNVQIDTRALTGNTNGTVQCTAIQ
jgi:hypothetical protein